MDGIFVQLVSHLQISRTNSTRDYKGGRQRARFWRWIYAAIDSKDGLPTVAHALIGKRERRLVDHNSASWNQVIIWLRHIEVLRIAASFELHSPVTVLTTSE
jgi:hypothetical protein